MQQIAISSSRLPSSVKTDAAAEARLPGDGFEALLAGLIGLPMGQTILTAAPERPLALPGLPGDAGADGLGQDLESAGQDAGGEGLPNAAGTASIPPKSVEATPLAGMAAVPSGTVPHAATPPVADTPSAPAPALPTLAATSPGASVAPQALALGSKIDRPASTPDAAASGPPSAMAAVEATAQRPAGNEVARRNLVLQGPNSTVRPGISEVAGMAPHQAASARLVPGLQGQVVLGGFAAMQLMAAWDEPAEGLASGLSAAAPGAVLAADSSPLPSVETTAPISPPVRQLAVAIERAVTGELRHLTIQLSPEALGSIEIAVEFDADRRLGIAIFAERPETLELLRGDARQLERLLGQQGVALADGELSFGLMSEGRGDRQAQDGRAQNAFGLIDRQAENAGDDGNVEIAQELAGNAAGNLLRPGRLNLSI